MGDEFLREPFENVQMDIIPEQRSADGFKYILMITDYLSKYVSLSPLGNRKGRELTAHFNKHVKEEGSCNTLYTNDSPEMTSGEIAEFYDTHDILHVIGPFTPEAQASIEESIRIIQNMIE